MTPCEPAPTPTRKRKKSTAPRAPRTIDPGVAQIRKEASERIKEYHKSQASEKLLATILDKRLPQLTTADKEKLFDHLKLLVTPKLDIPE